MGQGGRAETKIDRHKLHMLEPKLAHVELCIKGGSITVNDMFRPMASPNTINIYIDLSWNTHACTCAYTHAVSHSTHAAG